MTNGQGRKSQARQGLGPQVGPPPCRLSPSAEQTLALLRRQPDPVDLATLARQAGLHPNTVREHLDALVRLGRATRSSSTPRGRGRPAWLYVATAPISQVAEYAGLVGALSAVIARSSQDPATDAMLAGQEWGRDLAHQRGATTATPEVARDRAVELLADLGFAPRQDDPLTPAAVRLTRCPLIDAARRDPGIVCSVHHGVLRGALSAYGADPTGSVLVPFAEPGACTLIIPPVET